MNRSYWWYLLLPAALGLPFFLGSLLCEGLTGDFAFICQGRVLVTVALYPVVVAIWQRKKWNRALTMFFGYVVATFLVNLLEQLFIWGAIHVEPVQKWMVGYQIQDTSFLLILYHTKNYFFLGLFYSLLVLENKRTWIKGGALVLMVISLINYLFIEGYRHPGYFNPTADALFTFCIPLFYLVLVYRKHLEVSLGKNSYFWFSLGLLLPNLLGFFSYFMSDFLHEYDYDTFLEATRIKNLFEIISQVLLAIGFWFAPYVKYLDEL